jgi:insulin receptor
LDNPNLQELWTTWDENTTLETKQLIIKSGKIFFHLNPKLCYNKIERMQKYVEIVNYPAPWDSHDVSQHSNGDKVACDVSKLKAEIWKLNSEMVGIRFEDFKKQMGDQRSLLGYLIYYRET